MAVGCGVQQRKLLYCTAAGDGAAGQRSEKLRPGDVSIWRERRTAASPTLHTAASPTLHYSVGSAGRKLPALDNEAHHTSVERGRWNVAVAGTGGPYGDRRHQVLVYS